MSRHSDGPRNRPRRSEKRKRNDFLNPSNLALCIKKMPVQTDPLNGMTLRIVKTAVGLLLGFVLVWQSVFTISASAGTREGKSNCCRAHCNSKSCSTPTCCVKPNAPSAPVAPAPVRSATQNELLALTGSVIPFLTPPSRAAVQLPARTILSASVTALPLFRRDCSYLL